MPGRRRVRIGIALLVGVGIIGTSFFWFVEHWSLLDATYQTATTITTVGFGEVRPFDASAKVFSIFLMVVGVATALFTLGAVFEESLEESLLSFGRRRMDRRIDKLTGHSIVCGYGRVGSEVAKTLADQCVVVDLDESQCALATERGHLAVRGSSTEDEILLLAGVERAETIVVSLASDADAISTVLSAKVLNPKVRIVARVNAVSSKAKLLRAGCDRVVNPLQQGAHTMATFAQQPSVAEFLDVVVHDGEVDYRLEELLLAPDSPLAGTLLSGANLRARTGALVLALRRSNGSFVANPGADARLEPGGTLIAFGTSDQLQQLEQLLAEGLETDLSDQSPPPRLPEATESRRGVDVDGG